MFNYFSEFLYGIFSPFRLVSFLTFRSAFAALTTLLICVVFGGRIIAFLRKLKVGQTIREDGPQTHLIKTGTPTMGGVFIILSVVISMLLWGDLQNKLIWITMGAFLAFGAIGFIDDYLKLKRHNSAGLPAWAKFVMQIIAAIIIVFIIYFTGDQNTTALYIPFFKEPVLDMGWIWIPFAILLIVGESNAVNITDGLDGLLAGLLILVFLTLAILTYITGRFDYSTYLGIPHIPEAGELTVFCLAAAGACVGFLWFNAHPADVFMGDTGSLSLGGVIAVISLVTKKELLIFVIGGVFVLEIASVIIQVVSFKLRKKRVFKMAPLHHHYELIGWPETKTVIRFWILGGLFALIALSTLRIQ
ncbi:MAG: phospho-N-acetylmuramoyl-pentapeptide-transferase [Treponema sp.]|jgi:phospho-N-acetylmuramoyl-pentapeptide-transferase|nr:phospho-N-acetylmuramoyl-pentapeptide-transferase [Treponema sp.]